MTGRRHEIKIWFILCRERFYYSLNGAKRPGGSKNIRRSPNASVRIRKYEIEVVAKVLDYRTDRPLWDEVQAIAWRKDGWGVSAIQRVATWSYVNKSRISGISHRGGSPFATRWIFAYPF